MGQAVKGSLIYIQTPCRLDSQSSSCCVRSILEGKTHGLFAFSRLTAFSNMVAISHMRLFTLKLVKIK